MPACANCGEENPDRARFCLACGSPLAEAAPPAAPQAPDEERKLDTLVFVDLVGSTALAESLDPEDVLGLLELYYGRLRAELERCGGTVEKYIGDAIVTHFGVPVAHEDDPERAVRAALLILDTVANLNSEDPIREIKVRIGIATGEVIVTHGNKAEEGKGIAWGDVLNTAARIESAAPVNGILVGEETYRASSHAIEYVERDPIEAKGKAEPVRVWQAIGLLTSHARARVRDTALVGREAELDRLLALWQSVQESGLPGLATIIGDPGIGKSRLLAEVASRAADDAAVLWGRCLSYGEGITYWPMVEILEEAAGILKSDDKDTVSEKLGALLEQLGSDDLDQLRTMAAAIANLIGVPRTPRGTYSAADISQAELHWGIRRVLELLAARRPLMLVFEDLHWAEETLFDLIDFLSAAEAPIFVVGTGRRELEQLRPVLCSDGDQRIAVPLAALGEAESEALLARLLGAHDVPAGRHAELLLRNAAGNPLFLEETVRMLADSGALEAGGDLSELAVPTSLNAMIGSRLDALPSQDKRIAQYASVVGMTFWSGAVADLQGSDVDVDPSLGALEQREFVHMLEASSIADDREWAFIHALIKDVAYGRVPKGRRAQLHLRFADWLGERPDLADEVVEIVAYHLEQSCKLGSEIGRAAVPPPIERAIEALMRAAEKSSRREGIREADRYYARALDLVGDEQSERALELRLSRAGTLNLLGELGRADEYLGQVSEGAGAAGRLDLRAGAMLGRANVARKRGRGADARRYAEEAEALAAELSDRSLQVRAIYEAAHVRSWFEGAGEEALEELWRARAIAEELDDVGLRIEGHVWMILELYNLGQLAAAEQQCRLCLELVGDSGTLRDEARVTFQLGLVTYHLGGVEEAERLGLQALEWLERTGERSWQLQTLRTLALCALARSDLELAEERLKQAIPLALEIGGMIVDFYRILVEVLVEQDRLDDANDLASLALTNLPEEDAYARAAGLMIRASIATAEAEHAAADEHYAEVLRLLEQQQLPLDLGEARFAYGRALRRSGDDGRAVAELTRAREDLHRMGAAGLVSQIDRELDQMAQGAGSTGPLPSS